jgi:hypothetical protein
MMMHEKVLKDYPQLRSYLNSDKEFCFRNPTQKEKNLIYEVMKREWLSVNYNCIDGDDWYFIFDPVERVQRERKEEGYYSTYYAVDKGFIDSTGAYISYEAEEGFTCYAEAESRYNEIDLLSNEYVELVLWEWYNDDEITERIQLKERGA